MKYIRLLVFTGLFILGCTFAFQNQKLILHPVVVRLDLWIIPAIESIPMPLGGVILLSFLVGIVVAVVYLFFGQLILHKKDFQKNSRIRQLEKELQKVREQVLEDDEKDLVSVSSLEEDTNSSLPSSVSKFKA